MKCLVSTIDNRPQTVAFDERSDKVRVFGKKGTRFSEELKIKPRFHDEFKKFV